jgi:transcriptional regulator with XRE-family HTH domain
MTVSIAPPRRLASDARTADLATRTLLLTIAREVLRMREALGWSQAELAAKAAMSQSTISRVEHALAPELTVGKIRSIAEAMGGRIAFELQPPLLVAGGRQRDAAHARCLAHVRGRLERSGWMVEREVETADGRARGWIDLVAFHPITGTLLILEIKTELVDFGAVERQLGFYERVGTIAAARFGWRARSTIGCLVVLATEANEVRLKANRDSLARSFPLRADDLRQIVEHPDRHRPLERRGFALVDPLSRRVEWLRPARIDGRRSPAPFADYADFMRQTRKRRDRGRRLG